jgi:hypothetical protein
MSSRVRLLKIDVEDVDLGGAWVLAGFLILAGFRFWVEQRFKALH